jgi:hypothetical protein
VLSIAITASPSDRTAYLPTVEHFKAQGEAGELWSVADTDRLMRSDFFLIT